MKNILAIAIVGLLGAPLTAGATTVTLTDWSDTGIFKANAGNGGGAFLATVQGGTVGGATSFMTFCLEFSEHFNYGVAYNLNGLSDNAMNGGVGGGPNGDPVDDATKWLYYQAAVGGSFPELLADVAEYSVESGKGALSYNVNLTGAYVQEAVWYLEQERTASQVSSVSRRLAEYSIHVQQSSNYANQDWAALSSQGHRVYAMNLTTIPEGGVVQDQLAYVFVVPEPGTLAATLAGLGILAAAGAKMRRRRNDARA